MQMEYNAKFDLIDFTLQYIEIHLKQLKYNKF